MASENKNQMLYNLFYMMLALFCLWFLFDFICGVVSVSKHAPSAPHPIPQPLVFQTDDGFVDHNPACATSCRSSI